MITIRINIRQLGKKRNTINAVPFVLPKQPNTVRDLITSVVMVCVAAYNERVRKGETIIRPMTQESLSDMEIIGKLAFGVNYGGKEANEAKAVTTALQGFKDGLYRAFLDETELVDLDAPLMIRENDTITFIRLTMLTGSIW
ncbi:MAG: hypothetical protein IJN57_06865 [Oscillospiraceae bacterium]|nr:hypothetical protein [Oscillospiraceae bacterium]